MNILRSILIGLLSIVCITAVSVSVYLMTLQSTVMQPTVVKGWLRDSKVYDGKIMSALVQAGQGNDQQNNTSPQAISATPDQVKTALNGTFSAGFVQTQVEGLIDNAYAWMDGTTPTFSFSIPVDQKRDTLIQQLSAAIEPQIAALPVCTQALVAAQTPCRPSGETAAQFATQLTTQNLDQSGMFKKPITNETLEKSNQNSGAQPKQSPLSQLPAAHQFINQLTIIAPIIAVVSITLIIIISRNGERLLASMRLSRRIFFSMIFTFIGALVFLWLTRNSDFGLSNVGGQASDLLLPIVKVALADIAKNLALYTGIVCVVSTAVWIGISVWLHKHKQAPIETVVPTPTDSVPPQIS